MVFESLDLQTIIIFIVFAIVIFLIYKVFRITMKVILIAAIAFAFPWIVQYLRLPLPITASISTGLQFAILGVALFLIITFLSSIKKIANIVAWPFRFILKKGKKPKRQ